MFRGDPKAYLQPIGKMQDSDIDVFQGALALAMMDRPDLSADTYQEQFQKLSVTIQQNFIQRCATANGDQVTIEAASLKAVLFDQEGYIGDDIAYDHFDNISMTRVMDRKMGIPITLCILAVALARAQGWNADGLNFPGHFLMRLEKDGERLVLDPFRGFMVLEAKDLRALLKHMLGEGAELSASYYEPCSNRDMLLRLQNNMKYRYIDQGQYKQAMQIVKRMEWIAPGDARILLDKAVLFSRLEQHKAAIEALELYIPKVADPYDKAEAQQFLSELRGLLH